MQLLFIRHGVAADRQEFAQTGADDDQRPLSGRGRRRTRQAAEGLARLVPEVDLLAASPLVRARQAAEIVAEVLATDEVVETAVLRPAADPQQLVGWLSSRPELLGTAALVGHEPHLSTTISWLLCGGSLPAIEVKKASAVLLELVGGRTTLLWALPPRVLRGLASAR